MEPPLECPPEAGHNVGQLLQAAQGAVDHASEFVPGLGRGFGHTGLDVGPHQFVGIELGRVWRQEEQLQSVRVVLDEGSHQSGLMRGVSVDHKEHLALHAGDQPLQELAKYLGVDATLDRHEAELALRGDC
jgi:hypothetical protein